MMAGKIDQQDVLSLRQRPNAYNKSIIARKVGVCYSDNISKKNRELAEAIFRILLRDTEEMVREVVSDTLKNTKGLPEDIVDTIVKDVDSVSVPFIENYAFLSDDKLIKIVKNTDVAKQKAVAKRSNLSKEVAGVISQSCGTEVLRKLLENDGAQIDAGSLQYILATHPEEDLKKIMVYRSSLPFEVVEELVDHISYKLKTYLVLNHNLPHDFSVKVLQEIKEKMTLKISEEYSQDDQIRDFVSHIYKANRLNYSLVTRAICSGDLTFFEHSLSLLAGISVGDVRKILFSSQADFEVRNLLRKAWLPKTVFPAIFSALKIIKDIRFDCGKANNRLFSRKVIERIVSSIPTSDELSYEDITYLISQIN